MDTPEQSTANLPNALSEMFCEEVGFDVLQQKRLGQAAILVIRMKYARRESSGHFDRVVQTAVVLNDPELDLPQFALWPHQKGIAGMLLGRLSGMTDINFDDSPEFSDAYHLHGWNERAVRILFIPPMRDHFARQPGWSARGNRKHLVVFKHDQVCEPAQLDAFVDESQKILGLFQQGEESLDELPEVQREASIENVVATAERMGGIHAIMIKQELQKSQVSAAELDAFLAQPTPRSTPPRGLRYQVGGDNGLLIVLGAVFLAAGIALPILIWMLANPNDRWMGIPFALLFPMIGGLILVVSIGHRRKKKRLLHSGVLATGKVTKVERTNVQINNAQRYHLHLDYQVNGENQSAVANLYSNIERARTLATTGEPVRVLVDPVDHQTILCIDTLLIFD